MQSQPEPSLQMSVMTSDILFSEKRTHNNLQWILNACKDAGLRLVALSPCTLRKRNSVWRIVIDVGYTIVGTER